MDEMDKLKKAKQSLQTRRKKRRQQDEPDQILRDVAKLGFSRCAILRSRIVHGCRWPKGFTQLKYRNCHDLRACNQRKRMEHLQSADRAQDRSSADILPIAVFRGVSTIKMNLFYISRILRKIPVREAVGREERKEERKGGRKEGRNWISTYQGWGMHSHDHVPRGGLVRWLVSIGLFGVSVGKWVEVGWGIHISFWVALWGGDPKMHPKVYIQSFNSQKRTFTLHIQWGYVLQRHVIVHIESCFCSGILGHIQWGVTVVAATVQHEDAKQQLGSLNRLVYCNTLRCCR